MHSVFQIKSCLCWEILLTLIHGSNEGRWSILMSSNPLKEFSKNCSPVVSIYGVLRTTPYNRRCLFHARYNAPSARGVREWLFCSWSGVACTKYSVLVLGILLCAKIELKKHARK